MSAPVKIASLVFLAFMSFMWGANSYLYDLPGHPVFVWVCRVMAVLSIGSFVWVLLRKPRPSLRPHTDKHTLGKGLGQIMAEKAPRPPVRPVPDDINEHNAQVDRLNALLAGVEEDRKQRIITAAVAYPASHRRDCAKDAADFIEEMVTYCREVRGGVTLEDVVKAADAGTFGPADMPYEVGDDPIYRARTWVTHVAYPDAIVDRYLQSEDAEDRRIGELLFNEANGHPEYLMEYPAPNIVIALKTACEAIKKSRFPFNQAVILEIVNRD